MENLAVTVVCPHCGERELAKADYDNRLCPTCGKHFVLSIAEKLGRVKIDRTEELKNLHENLVEAVRYDDVDAIIKNAEKIKDINSDSYLAKYYFAYGKRQRDDANYINDFYKKSPKEEDCTTQELEEIITHVMYHCAFNAWEDAEKFISGCDGFGLDLEELKNKFKVIYEDRSKQEQKYFDYPRDVFVCHSSKDKETVDKIVDYLENTLNKEIWISGKNLRPNDSENYWKSIEKAIKNCKHFLLIYSENAEKSTDVARELAFGQGRPIIEINLDGTEHVQNSIFDKVLDGIMWIDGTKGLGHITSQLGERIYNINNKTKTEPNSDDIVLPTINIETDLETELEPTFTNGMTLLYRTLYLKEDEQNYKKAYNLFMEGQKKGDVKCWFGVGICLYHGYGVPKDEDAALHISNTYVVSIKELAKVDSEAKFIMYYYARYFETFTDKEKVNRWLADSAFYGSELALYHQLISINSSEKPLSKKMLLKKRDILSTLYEKKFYLTMFDYGETLYSKGSKDDKEKAEKCYVEGHKLGDKRCTRRVEEINQYKKGFEVVNGHLVGLTPNLLEEKPAKITIPASAGVDFIDAYALNYDFIEEVVIENSKAKIDDAAFGGNKTDRKIKSLLLGGFPQKLDRFNNQTRSAVKEKKQNDLKNKQNDLKNKAEDTFGLIMSKIDYADYWIRFSAPILVAVVLALVGIFSGWLEFNWAPWPMIVFYSIAMVIICIVSISLIFENCYGEKGSCYSFSISTSYAISILSLLIMFGGAIETWWENLIVAIIVLVVGGYYGFVEVQFGDGGEFTGTGLFDLTNFILAFYALCVIFGIIKLSWAPWYTILLCIAGIVISIWSEIDDGESLGCVSINAIIQLSFLMFGGIADSTAEKVTISIVVVVLTIISVVLDFSKNSFKNIIFVMICFVSIVSFAIVFEWISISLPHWSIIVLCAIGIAVSIKSTKIYDDEDKHQGLVAILAFTLIILFGGVLKTTLWINLIAVAMLAMMQLVRGSSLAYIKKKPKKLAKG